MAVYRPTSRTAVWAGQTVIISRELRDIFNIGKQTLLGVAHPHQDSFNWNAERPDITPIESPSHLDNGRVSLCE